MADIFISYSSANRETVSAIAKRLEDSGYSIWLDQQIKGGKRYAKDIEAAIQSSKAVIVAWSQEAADSHWVLDEASYARDAGKIVPIRLDDKDPPMGFRQVQLIDFSGGPDDDKAMAQLAEALDAQLGETHEVAASTRSKSPSMPKIAAIMVGLLLLVGGGWWFSQQGSAGSKSEAISAPTIDRSKSIAVLPMRDLSEGGGQDWLAAGLVDEITLALGRVPDLLVASSATAAGLAEDGQTPIEIAESLRVGHVLEGTVRRADEQLRVNVALVDAGGKQVWAERYDRSMEDLLAVQEDIATSVAKALNTAMDPEELSQMVASGTSSIEAYEAFARAKEERVRNSNATPAFFESINRAIKLDPDYSQAYAELANAYGARTLLMRFESLDRREGNIDWRDARAAARKALETAKNPKDTLVARWNLAELEGRYRDTNRLFMELQDRYPNDAAFFVADAFVAGREGNYAEAVRLAKLRIETFEVVDPNVAIELGRHFRDPQFSSEVAARVMGRDPSFISLYQAHRAFVNAGELDAARRVLDRMQAMSDSGIFLDPVLFRQACAEGRRDDALAILNRTQNPDMRWMMWSLLGEPEKARAEVIRHDRDSPPYSLAGISYFPFFDSSMFPNFEAHREREGLPRIKPIFDYQCAVEQGD